MDTLKNCKIKSRILFCFNNLYNHPVSHLQQGTVYSLIKCIYKYTVVEWPTHLMNTTRGDLVAAAVKEPCLSIGPTSGR